MSYSIISVLALVLNIIINHEGLRHFKISSKEQESEQLTAIRYSHFLTVATCYFIADIAWGLLYDYRAMQSVRTFLFLDCTLYFAFMFLTIVTWMRYIVAYLNKKGRLSKILLRSIWILLLLGLIYLIANCFHPLIFSFNAEHEYAPKPGRHIVFILNGILYMLTMVYVFYSACRTNTRNKARYIAVGSTCLAMNLFMVLQILDPSYPFYAMGLLIGICAIHSFVEAGEMKEKEIYDHIATSLAEDYEAMYYIDIETGEYLEFSTTQEYDSMNVPIKSRDFYAEVQTNIENYAHPDDREFAKSLHLKETMLKNLEGKKSYSYKYRVMVGGQPKHFQFTVMKANDNRNFILYVKDIENAITAETMRFENQKNHVTFSQVAEILAINYDVIYYVNAKDSSYIIYECRNIYGNPDMQKSGDDFFTDAKNNISKIVYNSDRELVLAFIDKDHIISTLNNHKSCSIDYRIMAFKKTHYARITVRKSADGSHYIMGVENIDDEVKKEKRHLKELNTEKELARRDELTGIKNKTAYNELEKSVQTNMDNGMDYLPFGLVVCDANNLKRINDTEGHVAGDEYIKKSAMLLCDTFVHSPVFRFGGDEFVVFLRGNDYLNKEKLMESLHAQVMENLKKGSGPILASGMAEYTPKKDTLFSEVFDRADKEMYKNKRKLKKEESNL
ncbi:MAG: GGDEF domain-containing protein [Treponema sp.]|nr:GGDEF domain-containing protein [Treponema sp.]